VFSAWWVPALVEQETHTHGLLISLASAALGLGGLWLVVELGKLAFGRKKFVFEQEQDWQVTQPDENEPPVVVFGEHRFDWADLFMRTSDRMVVSCNALRVNERSFGPVMAELWVDKLKVREGSNLEEFDLEGVTTLRAKTMQVVIPREAMGFGDVLFLMMIGAFNGWQAVLFTILAASVLGTVFAVIHRVTGRAEWGAKIPFGPYLAMGAVLWIFYGPQVVDWYISKTMWR
jgi:leader peptidase (prepilin peptidase)/N-methyltransferase